MNNYCFDTHSLVWYFGGNSTLSSKALVCLEEVYRGKAFGVVSTIVILETYYISLKNKKFVFPKFLQKLSVANISIIPVDFAVVKECFSLPRKLEIHDRIIVATSIITGSELVTKDKTIRSLHNLKTIW